MKISGEAKQNRTPGSGRLQRLVRSFWNGLEVISDGATYLFTGMGPFSDDYHKPRCADCGEYDARRNAKQEGECDDTRNVSHRPSNVRNSGRISFLIFFGDVGDDQISDARWNTEREQRQNQPSTRNFVRLCANHQGGGHLEASVCPHKLAEFISFCVVSGAQDLTRIRSNF